MDRHVPHHIESIGSLPYDDLNVHGRKAIFILSDFLSIFIIRIFWFLLCVHLSIVCGCFTLSRE